MNRYTQKTILIIHWALALLILGCLLIPINSASATTIISNSVSVSANSSNGESHAAVRHGHAGIGNADSQRVGVGTEAEPAARAEALLGELLGGGLRMAGPGEFTARAYLNGKIDLSQAEAVCDVIRARTDRGADAALAALAGKLGARIVEIESSLLDLLARLEASLDFAEDVGAIDRAATANLPAPALTYDVDVLTIAHSTYAMALVLASLVMVSGVFTSGPFTFLSVLP